MRLASVLGNGKVFGPTESLPISPRPHLRPCPGGPCHGLGGLLVQHKARYPNQRSVPSGVYALFFPGIKRDSSLLCRESNHGRQTIDEPISTVIAYQLAFRVGEHGRYRRAHGQRWRCILVGAIDAQTECSLSHGSTMFEDNKIGDIVSREQCRGPLVEGSKDLLLPMERTTGPFPDAIGREAPGGNGIIAEVQSVVHPYYGLPGGNDKGQFFCLVHGFHYLEMWRR